MAAETPKTLSLEGWKVYVRSDLREYEIFSEDGPRIIAAEVFYLVAEFEDGSRFRGTDTFSGHAAEYLAELEARAVRDLGELVLDRWMWAAPCYGSEAYCRNFGF